MPSTGYVFLVVQRENGRAEVECVIRPLDLPEGCKMTDVLDAATEADGLEIPANPLNYP